MLIAFYITYNDMPLIEKSLESVSGKFDNVYAVDGRFEDFPGRDDYSTDGTLEYLRRHEVSVIKLAGVSEPIKRDVVFDVAGPGDTVLVIDADEVLVGDVSPISTDCCRIMISESVSGARLNYTNCSRLIKVCQGLHYSSHHAIVDSSGQLFADSAGCGEGYTISEANTFYLEHLRGSRGYDRDFLKKIYYKTLEQNEKVMQAG